MTPLSALGAELRTEVIDGIQRGVLTFVCPICRIGNRLMHHQPVVIYGDGPPTTCSLGSVYKRVHGTTIDDLSLAPPVEIDANPGTICPGGSALILHGAWQS